MGINKATTCNALKNGLHGNPLVVDADGSSTPFTVAAVIVSAGSKDADRDGNVFDRIVTGTFTGDNTDGRPNYIRYPPINSFDDILRYIGSYEIYSEVCEFLLLAVNNKSSSTVYVYDANQRVDLGRLRAGENGLYDVLSGSSIEIRNMPHGSGHIVNSNPSTPIILSGTGATINVTP